MPTVKNLLSNAKLVDVGSGTGIEVDRLRGLAQGADPNMSELRKLSHHFGIDVRELLPPGPRAKSAGLLFRQAGSGADERTVSDLSRRIGYSMDLIAANAIAGPWWAGRFRRGEKDY